MVVDLAIFGAIGTTAGIISFLANTVETLHKRTQEFLHYEDRLYGCQSRILVADQHLRNWRDIWYNEDRKPLPNAAYERFWGREGYCHIQRMLRGIETVNDDIERTLAGAWKDNLRSSPPPLQEWRRTLEELLHRERRPHSEDASPFRRLCFALFQSSYLEDSVNRMKGRVEELEKFARQEYLMRLGEEDLSQKISSKELHIIESVNRNLEILTNTMDAIYQDNQNIEKWTLVLGKPTLEDGLQNLRYGPNFRVEFVIDRNGKYYLAEVDLSRDREPSGTHRESDRLIQFEGIGCEVNLKGLLKLTGRDRPLRVEKKLTFATIAMKLANSIIFLGSQWTKGLCTCGIKIADDISGKIDVCTFRMLAETCHKWPWEDLHGLHPLGLILAQLGIGVPIRMPCDNNNNERQSQDHRKQTNDQETLSELEILGLVNRRVGPAYEQVIESCFDLSRLKHGLRAEHLRRSLNKIVKP